MYMLIFCFLWNKWWNIIIKWLPGDVKRNKTNICFVNEIIARMNQAKKLFGNFVEQSRLRFFQSDVTIEIDKLVTNSQKIGPTSRILVNFPIRISLTFVTAFVSTQYAKKVQGQKSR